MSATGPRLKSKKEYSVLEVRSPKELGALLNDQATHGWELDQVFCPPHAPGTIVVVLRKETPSA
jgi:hypothetical protein